MHVCVRVCTDWNSIWEALPVVAATAECHFASKFFHESPLANVELHLVDTIFDAMKIRYIFGLEIILYRKQLQELLNLRNEDNVVFKLRQSIQKKPKPKPKFLEIAQ